MAAALPPGICSFVAGGGDCFCTPPPPPQGFLKLLGKVQVAKDERERIILLLRQISQDEIKWPF